MTDVDAIERWRWLAKTHGYPEADREMLDAGDALARELKTCRIQRNEAHRQADEFAAENSRCRERIRRVQALANEWGLYGFIPVHRLRVALNAPDGASAETPAQPASQSAPESKR